MTIKDFSDNISGMKKITQKLNAGNGIITIEMRELRDMVGAKKLGRNVITRIDEKLAENNIRHYPNHLPNSQESVVRLYDAGSTASELINSVLTPSCSSDEVIRMFVRDCKGIQ